MVKKETGFFDAALRKGWKETDKRVVPLPEYEAEHFQLFFLWIYERRIFSAKADDVQKGNTDKEWDQLANAWTLGAYLQATDFTDAVTDAIIDKASQSGRHAPQSMHTIVYPKSLAGAPIRKLIVDIAVSCWQKSTLQAQSNDPAWSDFFLDLSVALLENRNIYKSQISSSPYRTISESEKPPWDLNRCVYHDHMKTKTSCYKSKSKAST